MKRIDWQYLSHLCQDMAWTIQRHANMAQIMQATECYENAIFQTLLEDPEFHDEFKKYYFTKDQFDYIEEYTDLMAELDTGDIIKHFIHLKDVEVERLHDGRWGVKSIEDRNLLRENVGDWFINQFVVLITDYPHVQAERETAEAQTICT